MRKEVVRLLEAAQQSMERNGRPIELASPPMPYESTVLPITEITA